MTMTILEELTARGLVADVSQRDELAALMAAGPVTFYAGYDPSGHSLHVGNLVPMILQARLQRAGHRPIVVVGGATGMIGDPSGKSAERNLLDDATLQSNLVAIRAQLGKFLTFGDGPTDAVMVNNADWFKDIGYMEFLRDVGKHLSINYMLAKDSVRSRLEGESGISYTEFSYMLLQAWDFVQLSQRYNCRLQVGGSDQWGNITAGCELSRRKGGAQLFGLVAPLLLDSAGNKMGKTSTGERVWLDPELTTPYQFHQYWLNVPDSEVDKLLKIFSLRPLDEIAELVRVHAEAPHKRVGQRALADDFTTWVHGADATRRATTAAAVLFGGELAGLGDGDLEPLAREVPSSTIARDTLAGGVPLIDLLVERGLCSSKGEARRQIAGGAIYVNNQKVASADLLVSTAHLATPSFVLLRFGKKVYHLMRAE
ncbi:MAG: tyrosine--tRNA ligase [Deltaproteobacteria bacterium]|nr:tyrosine--tRNA ligase [Deltaproteobacteria bacterium]